MSYYEEVKLEIPKDPGENEKPKNINPKFNSEKLKEAGNLIKQEFEKIRAGVSDLTTYPIDPGDFGFPTGNRLTMFLENPTQKNLDGFIQIARQDLGHRAAIAFIKWILKAKETNDE